MLEPVFTSQARPTPSFTGLPPEIRHQIYSYLLVSPKPLRIEVAPIPHHLRPFTPPSSLSTQPSTSTAVPNPTIKPHHLSSQLLRVSHLTHAEALPLLYTHNTYDVTARSSLHTLLLTLPLPSLHLITTLHLDWDSLQDFSFQLAKPSFLTPLSSLTTLALSTWRTRILANQSAFLWRDVQSYERTICAAARLITQRHPRLKLVAQRRWTRALGGRSKDIVRRNALRQQLLQQQQHQFDAGGVEHAIPPSQHLHTSSPAVPNIATAAAAGHNGDGETMATTRIKWRFIAGPAQLQEGEELLDLEAEVATLMAQYRPENEGAQQMALDPI